MANGEAETTPARAAPAPRPARRHVLIRAYPKVVFFWLTWIVSLICGIIEASSSAEIAEVPALWFGVFTFNLLVVSFEFTRILSVALIFFGFMLFFLVKWLGADKLKFLGDLLSGINPGMNAHFYFVVFGVFTLIFLFVFIQSRFNYWEIQPNEILHKRGFMGDVERYPAPNLRMTKEIYDVLEYILLRGGRLILQPSSERQAIILDTILNINHVEDRVKELLGSLQVTTTSHLHDTHDHP